MYNRLPEVVRLRIYNQGKEIYKNIFKNAPKYVYFQTNKQDAPIFAVLQNKVGRVHIRHTYNMKDLETPNIVYKFEEKFFDEKDYMKCNVKLMNNTITLFSTKKYHACAWSNFLVATFCYIHFLKEVNFDISKVVIPKEEDVYWLNQA